MTLLMWNAILLFSLCLVQSAETVSCKFPDELCNENMKGCFSALLNWYTCDYLEWPEINSSYIFTPTTTNPEEYESVFAVISSFNDTAIPVEECCNKTLNRDQCLLYPPRKGEYYYVYLRGKGENFYCYKNVKVNRVKKKARPLEHCCIGAYNCERYPCLDLKNDTLRVVYEHNPINFEQATELDVCLFPAPNAYTSVGRRISDNFALNATNVTLNSSQNTVTYPNGDTAECILMKNLKKPNMKKIIENLGRESNSTWCFFTKRSWEKLWSPLAKCNIPCTDCSQPTTDQILSMSIGITLGSLLVITCLFLSFFILYKKWVSVFYPNSPVKNALPAIIKISIEHQEKEEFIHEKEIPDNIIFVNVADDTSQTQEIASANQLNANHEKNFQNRVTSNRKDSTDDLCNAVDGGYELKIFVCEQGEDSGLPLEPDNKDIITSSQCFDDVRKLKICNDVNGEISTSGTSTVDSGNMSDMSSDSSFNKAVNSGNSFLSAKECNDQLGTQSTAFHKLAQLPVFINLDEDNHVINIPPETSSDNSVRVSAKDLTYYCEHDGYIDKNLRGKDEDSIYLHHTHKIQRELYERATAGKTTHSVKDRTYPIDNNNFSDKCEVISTEIELATSRQSSSSNDTGCETMSGIDDDYMNKSTFMEQLEEYLDKDDRPNFSSPTNSQLLKTTPSIQ